MALLTDPSGLEKPPWRLLVQRHRPLCFLLYILSIALFLSLASRHLNSDTYLSENALLPGLVVVGSDLGSDALSNFREIEDYFLYSREIPKDWLLEKFAAAHVMAYVHNFTLSRDRMGWTGQNVYGIIRGGGSSNEAIVLSVPWRSAHSPEPTTAPALALLLSIAKYFRKQKYWAKDLIMLVTEHEQVGMQAWLEAYHGVTCGSGILESGDLDSRGGAIQAAINLELHGDRMKYIEVKISGLNGQLPNLDLVNLVLRMCSKERVRHSVFNTEKTHNLPRGEEWAESLVTMWRMLLSQASAVPDGNHGLFHRFGIEAVTMEGIVDKNGPKSAHQVTLHHVARVVEGLFRSINNLLERFHQSYFFYLLAGTDKFVSIGLYIPCNALLVAVLFIRAFSLHAQHRLLKSRIEERQSDWDRCRTLAAGLAVGCLGELTTGRSLPSLFTRYFTEYSLKDSYLILCLSLSALSLLIPLLSLPSRKMTGKESERQDEETDRRRTALEWHCTALVLLGTLLLALGMANFSLAYLLALISVPVAVLLTPTSSSTLRWLKVFLWIGIHPLTLLTCLLACLNHLRAHDITLLQALGNSLTLAGLDQEIYGSWTLRLASVLYLTVWALLVPVNYSVTPNLIKSHKKTD